MGKWGIDNQICVKITIRKGVDTEVIYYRNKLPLWIVEQWKWYFEYIAALVKVNNPLHKVELIICAQTLKQGLEYIEEKTNNLLRAKKYKLKKLQNEPIQNDLFDFGRIERDKKMKAVQGEIEALERGEFNYYIPPTYINTIKNWINGNHRQEMR